MPNIADLVNGSLEPTVYLLTSDSEADEVESRLKDAGYSFFFLDGMKIRSKQEFFSVAAEAMSFPDYFGHNWEAFADCVTDLSWIPKGIANVILYDHFDVFASSAPGDFDHAYAGLLFATQRGTAPVPCYVLLRGDAAFSPEGLPKLTD